jgi:hypothetical protein
MFASRVACGVTKAGSSPVGGALFTSSVGSEETAFTKQAESAMRGRVDFMMTFEVDGMGKRKRSLQRGRQLRLYRKFDRLNCKEIKVKWAHEKAKMMMQCRLPLSGC